jgi:hypothetical protein
MEATETVLAHSDVETAENQLAAGNEQRLAQVDDTLCLGLHGLQRSPDLRGVGGAGDHFVTEFLSEFLGERTEGATTAPIDRQCSRHG